ncbi:DUF4190 domain-containing protein [Actinotalea sp. Marseille-Q4924]|uniref:DUF4190 domain-containing protein n=1 Tax=Actinotalea sp. Marseille-Q4924 TaxID=2866571 RepID=UPI001CE46E0A|nr:DUF4190 domain-containing protein [Actinotalea sp. Marseille-Q4924]
MSNPTGPQDPYGQQGDGSSWTPGQAGGSSSGPGQGSGPSWGQGQGGAPGGDMGGGYSAPPPPPGYYGGGAGGPMFSGTEKNNLGVWALVLGILGLVCCGFVTAIPAVILGNKSKEAAAMGQADNGGLGQAGVVLGWIGIVWGVLALIWLFFLGGMAVITEVSTGTGTGF